MADRRRTVDDNLPDWMQPYRGAGDKRKAEEKRKQDVIPLDHQFEVGQEVYIKSLDVYGVVYAYNPYPAGYMVGFRKPIVRDMPTSYANVYHPELDGGRGGYRWEPDTFRAQQQWGGLFTAEELQ